MSVEKSASSKVRFETVQQGQSGQRLDNFLAGQLHGAPRGLIYKIIRTGQVRINGGRAKPSTRLEAGDEVRIPPVKISQAGPKNVPAGALKSLEQAILEEDDTLLVLNKPAGMAVHAGSGVDWGVIDAVRELRGDDSIELVHRLDRDTSGLLLLARGKGPMRQLQREFREGRAEKRYFCLLDTRLRKSRVLVDQPLKKIERGGQRYVQVDPQGKKAITEFKLLDSYVDCSFAEANLLTGRTHQIRAHAAWLDGPLAGDNLYSQRDRLDYWRSLGLRRLFLHAHSLVIDTGGGRLRRYSCPLPEPLQDVLNRLQG